MKNILGVVLVLVVVLVCVIVTRPAEFHVERSASIAAPAATAFAQVDDFHNWAAWSPWEHLDAAMTKTYSGAPSGTGAAYSWKGNDKVGEGSMTITESVPDEKIVIQLEFLKPFQASNVTTFSFTPDANGTRVTWSMQGRNNFMAKAMSLMMHMDKVIGPDFEHGLAALKGVAEQSAAPADTAGAAATAP